MAQAVNRRPLTAEYRVRTRDNPYGICGGQSGTGTCFSPSSSVFPCQYHFTVVLHSYIIWGMNNMSSSGTSSETVPHSIKIKNIKVLSFLFLIIMPGIFARTYLFVPLDSIVLLYFQVHVPTYVCVSTSFLLFQCLISCIIRNVDV
jgi:hypothetical protein